MNSDPEKFLSFSEEVKYALSDSKPVVALESTIISHGMPYPQNYETAYKIENTVRENGSVPATIALLNGKIKIGLNNSEIEFISKESGILKASRRDIPVIISQKLNAATTVSATMICAALAGIKIFATGGIGGVHRNAQNTFDISADLTELSQTNVAVVSAGVKSILDIGLTLEYLETMGVPVIGYKTGEFPAFYTRESGFKVNYKLDSPGEIADAIKTKWDLGLSGGVIIANPIPEEYSMDKNKIEKAIDEALKEADAKGIKGKEVTPFLLSQIKSITEGKSLEANIQLVLNNAKLAAEISNKY
ncbi:MAG TPA: pseudouridine-5'-phosphate glycosidase [Ignavibacteria bacterium]|nr:pseudouridine-5'-phosphate glycosidase [Ignavibacteria bacterium]HMR41289.1 pseudouridine-5'-phosphate glycosidase [Ignavibacteria bacterium]